ncbi:sensor histidine kinase [Enhygromyxa salina]|uniref:histidine kinase n=1 Tax=Enhygromyxa salina TaxID=215803 RepID=A0A2S9YYI2_9BACT|nr:ATP-binding protein [Enhygromyxa salina]PRQ10134.1 Blue-light-activated protein [Enhygromyxa salina]
MAELLIQRRTGEILAVMCDLARGELDARVDPELLTDGGDDSDLYEDLDGICVALNMLAEELQATVVRRDQYELALRDLAHAQAQVVHSAKLAALGQLATGVAHELNQPLQIIGLSAEEARDAIAAGDMATALELLDAIEEQVVRGSSVAAHLLAFSRRDAHYNDHGEDGGDSTLASVNDVLTQAMSALGGQVRSEGIQFELDLAPDIEPISCQVDELLQVVANLVINARDALRGRSDARIVARSFVEHDVVGFEVADNGPGIPAADLDRIFDPFFTTKAVGRGAGLGLSIVHGIIDRHGGTVEALTNSGAHPPEAACSVGGSVGGSGAGSGGLGTRMRVRLPRAVHRWR